MAQSHSQMISGVNVIINLNVVLSRIIGSVVIVNDVQPAFIRIRSAGISVRVEIKVIYHGSPDSQTSVRSRHQVLGYGVVGKRLASDKPVYTIKISRNHWAIAAENSTVSVQVTSAIGHGGYRGCCCVTGH